MRITNVQRRVATSAMQKTYGLEEDEVIQINGGL